MQDGHLPTKPLQRSKALYRHDAGSATVPEGWIQIIIPCTGVKDTSQVFIRGPGLEETVDWNDNKLLLLSNGTRLLTLHCIFSYAIRRIVKHHYDSHTELFSTILELL